MSARGGRPRRWLRLIAAASARKRVLMRVCEAAEGAGAVAFEAEQVFAGVEDRFDSLPDRCEVGPLPGFVFAAWPDDCGGELGGGVFELAAGVALVADRR